MLKDTEGAKYIRITCHSHLHYLIAQILDNFGESEYTTCSRVCGTDADGRHFGTAVWPGNEEVFSILVSGRLARPLFDTLVEFKKTDPAHSNMRIAVIPVEHCG